MNCSMPSFPILHYLSEFAQTQYSCLENPMDGGGLEELDETEWLHFHFSLSCIGEGNGNPLQCSCLENPRDKEPGRLPSMGLQSRTRLKWLSSSSSSMSIESVMPSNHLISCCPLTSCCPQSFPALGFFQWVNSRGCFFFNPLGKRVNKWMFYWS